MRWDPDRFEFEGEHCEFILSHLTSVEPGTTYEIRINIAGSTEAALRRYLGCLMIGFMPGEGLDEALLSLHDMLQFYGRVRSPRVARLPPKAIDGTITDKKKRSNLVIA